MRAVIPAAGFGTRLKPHTISLPKVLLNVGGKPILAHIIDKLIEVGISKAAFVIGHLGDMIIDFVGKNYPKLQAEFIVQNELLGLGHAVYIASSTFNGDELFIILGDTIFDVELGSVFDDKKTSLGVKKVDNPSRFGVAVCENNKIVKLIEKPKDKVSDLALVGLYYIVNSNLLKECLDELIENNIRTNNEYQLTDALQLMIKKGEEITTFPVEGWYDCGKPETLLSTNKFLLDKNGTNRNINGVLINHPVFISANAVVKNSIVGPYTTIADDCVINDSVIVNSIVNTGALVERAILNDSIIGYNTKIIGNFKKFNTGDSSEIEFH